MKEQLYEAVKFYQSPDKKAKVLRKDLTIEEARAYCDDTELSSFTAQSPKGCGSDERKIKEWGNKRKHWFVGFREQ